MQFRQKCWKGIPGIVLAFGVAFWLRSMLLVFARPEVEDTVRLKDLNLTVQRGDLCMVDFSYLF